MYARASSALSCRPAARMRWLFGTQMQPPDIAVVPPISSDFSATSTRAPRTHPVSAAASPAAPEPRTTRSYSLSDDMATTHLSAQTAPSLHSDAPNATLRSAHSQRWEPVSDCVFPTMRGLHKNVVADYL